MARGVDGLAHQAALNAGGRTIAVLGCGVDRIYPPEHRSLAESIIENGAMVSDYPPGTPPEGVNFPPRNRIISGLSLATIVIEAGDSSGALITSTFAVEQGRDVFAVPGNINAVQSRGTNRLIQQGARPLLKPNEVLDALNLQQIQEHRALRTILPANETEEKLLRVIGKEPLHVDEIRNKSDLPISEVTSTLTLMELKGMVQQVGGMNYVVTREEYAEYKVSE
jgi:DNA processing protein